MSLQEANASLLLDSNSWSRTAPLQAVALACDDNHSSLLIAERYALHELLIHPSDATGSALQKCLARFPAFHAAGFTGVRVKCGRAGCDAIVLGAEKQSLVCPLGPGKRCEPFLVDSESSPRGCDLQDSKTSGEENFLPSPGFKLEKFSDPLFLEKSRPAVPSLGRKGRLLMRLSDDLFIEVWSLDSAGSATSLGTMSLPETHRWTQLCNAHQQIFLLGRPLARPESQTELWSFPLPKELQ